MNSRATVLLAIGIVGAIVIARGVPWGDKATVASATDASSDTIQSVTEQDAMHVNGNAGRERLSPAGSSAHAVTSRPDAGYYDHPGRPYGVAGNLFFTFILHESELDTEVAIDKIVEVTRVERDTAWEYLGYIRKAKVDLQRYQTTAIDRMCEQRDQITTISQLAATLEKTDTDVETHRAQLTRGSESILGADGMRSFEMYIAGKDRGKKPFVPNNEARLKAMNKSPAEVLARLCDTPQP